MSLSEQDLSKIEEGVKLILDGIGRGYADDSVKDTPKRVAKMYDKILGGEKEEPPRLAMFDAPDGQAPVVSVRFKFFSMCEHHLLPFVGFMDLMVLQKEKVMGLSKFIRIAKHFAKRATLQERLGEQIVDFLYKPETGLNPTGVALFIRSAHGCMTLRGAQSGGHTSTYHFRGIFKDSVCDRQMFFENIKHHGEAPLVLG